jgi:hypothetical protein
VPLAASLRFDKGELFNTSFGATKMMHLDPTTDLLSREQAAAELGVSLGALRGFHRNGRIEFLKINQKCVRVTRAALDKLKAEFGNPTGSAAGK